MDRICTAGKGDRMIVCADPQRQYMQHKKEIDGAIARVLKNGHYILGNETKSFENEFSSYTGNSYGIGVGSGTEAIHIALVACGIKPGDEVITVSHTAVATIAAIELAGAKPVLVDIERDFYTLDPKKIEAVINRKTRAIMPVHIYGLPADIDAIMAIAREYGLCVIEDCAQAHGAKYKGKPVGSFGIAGCFSFYPTKNLGAIGDAGMVVTNNAGIAQKARLLREYGWQKRYISSITGWNSRLDELQAAILRVKLKYLDFENKRRRELADIYNNELSGIGMILPKVRKGSTHVYHQYVIRAKGRDRLQKFLKNNGISTLIHYPQAVHSQPAYYKRLRKNNLNETELIVSEILSLPINPQLTNRQIIKASKLIKKFKAVKRT